MKPVKALTKSDFDRWVKAVKKLNRESELTTHVLEVLDCLSKTHERAVFQQERAMF
jgi:hypothetical protein